MILLVRVSNSSVTNLTRKNYEEEEEEEEEEEKENKVL